jgi:archaellum biogenesis ATPase FlaH
MPTRQGATILEYADVVIILRRLIDILLELTTPEIAKDMINEAAIKRANAIADAAEKVKFGDSK